MNLRSKPGSPNSIANPAPSNASENKATKDPCLAGELMRRSALYGRIAGQIGFPFWSLKGRFAGCAVKQDPKEMLGFLEAADKQTSDFYRETAIELLQDRIKARLASKQ